MIGYEFKTYIANGREYFLYREKEIRDIPFTKKDFPFPESLLALVYLDIWSLELLIKKIDHVLRELYQTKEERCAQEVLTLLEELSHAHIYFEFLFLDWKWRVEKARHNGYRDVVDLMPHKQITHIPSNIDTMQKQILALFAKALDIDGYKKPISQKMVEYYTAQGGDTLHTFQFRPQPMNFEVVDSKTFAEVLYPDSIYDLIDYALRECIKREVKLRICKNCGRYFYFTGRTSAEYCSRVIDDKGRTCKDVGAAKIWTKNKSDDKVFSAYRKEYKKRFAWIKADRISDKEFHDWSKKAREKKAECDNGGLSLEEFVAWLGQS